MRITERVFLIQRDRDEMFLRLNERTDVTPYEFVQDPTKATRILPRQTEDMTRPQDPWYYLGRIQFLSRILPLCSVVAYEFITEARRLE